MFYITREFKAHAFYINSRPSRWGILEGMQSNNFM